jgi:hypothetical protein
MGSLARCYCTSRLSERSLNSALSCGWLGSSRQGRAELRELLARPDADGGEVPDRVVGSHIGPFSSERVSALLRRDSLYPGLTGNRVSTWGVDRFGPSEFPPPFMLDFPLPSHGDQVLVNHLARNQLEIAQTAREFTPTFRACY